MKARNVKLSFALMLTGLVLLCSGCATPSAPQVVQCPAIPQIPSVAPLPPQSYSLTVQQDINRWANALTSTPQTSKP